MLSRISFRMLCVGVAFATALTGCGDDDPVGKVDADAVGADADTSVDTGGDIGGDLDATPSASLTFSVEHKKGPSLVDPINAAIFDLSMDKYDTLEDAGFQLDVIVTGKNVPDGTEVEVLVGGASGGKATMTDGSARIDKVTIPCSAVQLNLGVRAAVSGAEVVSNKSVLLNCGNACNAALVPVTGCLSEDADTTKAGFQAAFTVTTATTDCTHAYLTVTDTNGKVSDTEKVALSAGKATIVATIASSDTGLNGAKASVVAVVEDQAHTDRPAGKSAAQDVTVTTDKPEVSFVSPAKDTLTLADDSNGDPSDGVQVTLVGTATTLTASDIGAIKVYVDGAEVATTSLKLNGSFDVDLSFAASKTYTVKVTATNGCGLVGEFEKAFTVIANKAKMTITAPATGSILLAKDDTNTATKLTYDTTFSVALQDALDGASIGIFCRKNEEGSAYDSAAVGKAQVVGGAGVVDVSVAIDTAVYGTSVVCIARDDAQNPAESLPIVVTLAVPPPCMTIQLPEEGFVTAATSLAIGATATGLDGAVVEAKVQLVGGATFIDTPVSKFSNGSFTASVALQVGSPPVLLPDGTYTVTLGATDAFGNDVADGSCSTLTRTFSIDRTAPKLVLAIPTKTVLDPVVDPDQDDTTLGYQTQVVYALSGEPASATSTVCISVNGFASGCEKITGNGNITFTSVSLQPGNNTVVAVATDSLGNKSKEISTAITLQSNAVVVTWQSPVKSTVVATASLPIEVKVTNQKNGTAILGASMGLVVNGVELPDVSFAEVGGGVYSATVPTLAAGDSILLVSAVPSSGGTEGVTPPLTVTLKTSKPTAAITTFSDGEVLNLLSTKCVQGLKDCVTNVAAKTTNVGTGATATLSVQCGAAAAVEYQGTVNNGAVSFNTVTLTHGGICTLVLDVVDEAGQSAPKQTSKVTVDRVVPKINGLQPNKTTFVAIDDTNNKADDGIQVVMTATVAGLSSAATVTLSIFDDSGAKVGEYKANPNNTVGDDSSTSAVFGLVTLPAGKSIKATVSAVDLAGNSTSLTRTLLVIPEGAEIRITEPIYVNPVTCTSAATCGSGVCVSGKCAVGWNKLAPRQVKVVGLGLAPGASVRICSDNGNVTGTGCATSGRKAVGTAQTFDGSSAVVVLTTLPEGLHNLIAEALPAGADGAVASNWVSSENAAVAVTMSRRLLYDATAPKIASVLPPSVTGVPSGCLSRASQSSLDSGAPGGAFNFAGKTTTEEATISILQSGNIIGSAATTSLLAGIAIKITAEGSAALVAVAKDSVGNESEAFAVGTFNVDTIVPVGNFLAPNKGTLISGDSLDVLVGSPSSDTNGQAVVLKDGTTTVGSVTMSNGQASFTHALYGTLSDGEHSLTATIQDACANSTTVATIPSKVVVDTQGPTVSIAAPTAGQTFADGDDASTDGGYQVTATFGSTGAKSWEASLGTDCDANFANCAAFASVGSGSVTNDGGNEPSLSLTIPFGQTANYVFRVIATDTNGNKTTVDRNFKVSLSGCLVSLSGIPAGGLVNTSKCATPGANCASADVDVTAEYVGPCGNVDAIKLFKGSTELASKAPTSSAATFTVAFADGDDVKIEAKAMVGSNEAGTSGGVSVKADLTNPTVTFVAGTVAGESTPGGSGTALQGNANDLDVGKNGHQLHLLIRANDTALSGGKLVSLQNVSGASAVDISSSLTLPSSYSANGQVDVEAKFLTLTENATTKVRATVQDAAGNSGTADLDVKIDWTAPSAPTIAALTDADINARRPYVKLNFKAVGDDGDSTGTAASYEVVYSKSAIGDTAAFEAACKASALTATKIPTPAAAGSNETIVVEGPDARASSSTCKFVAASDNGTTTYYFAVRAVDAAGNKSAISNVISTTALRLQFAKVSSTVSPWDTNSNFQRVTAIGDVNGDGLADIAIGGQSASNKLCVIYGHAGTDLKVPDLDITAQNAATHTCFDNTAALGAEIAGPIDVNGDGVDDLVVSSGTGTGVTREIHVYLGEKGKALTTTAAVKLTNIYHNGANGVRALSSARNFNGDADGAEDIAVTVRSTTSFDRVMVLPGSKAWSTSSPISIDVESQTDRVTNNMAVITQTSASATNFFGFSLFAAGNVLTDSGNAQFDDLAIQRYQSAPFVYIVKGRSWTGELNLNLSAGHDGSGSADSTTVRIDPPYLGGAVRTFGQIDVVSFDGDAIPDLVGTEALSSSGTSALVWMRGAELSKFVGKTVSVAGSLVAGSSTLYKTDLGYTLSTGARYVSAIGDFGDQGDGTVAIVHSVPSWVGTGTSTVVIRQALKRADGLVTDMASYHLDDISVQDPNSPGATTMARDRIAGIGDFNGDGFADIAVATNAGYLVLIY